ncbi:carboxylesterase/lipase family protein [Pantoea agglomerans]|uniref:Carboxylesterase/lipase family protein n=1 Tax=Enterobacter agglomerans TaxID=549 RepID=A0ACC5RU48_ENTAG|nr:carboxylesterase/lipase family protein [Pantoea agglomerans]MBK4728236.1 carboxylesterase/lipase family protein [Pantoea agglomerans]
MRNERSLRIMTAEGSLLGSVEEGIFVFKGIPYAAPPVGELRWKAPKPVNAWQGDKDATDWGPASWQSREYCLAVGGGDPGRFHEDCLYLNVWTPDISPTTLLPVMVWIHGGGYAVGSGGLTPYLGEPLAQRGTVIVTINYRLGQLGFFAHPALDREYADGEVVNNFALLDQIAALQWVQRNIRAFGGNPKNVTLMGESSGARSVLSLFASPLAEGLFHKGIVQSAYGVPDVSRAEALRKGQALASHFNLPDASAEQLRALPAESFWPLDRALSIGPVAIHGDRVLPQPMLSVFTAARQQRLPLMIGSNSDEASVLAYFGVDAAKVIADIRRKHPLALRLIKLLYPDVWDDDELGRQVARDMTFTTAGYIVALAQHRIGMPGWRYYFDYVSENAHDLYPHGTWHGNEIPYVLNTLGQLEPVDPARPFTEGDHDFSQRVSEYWLRFARDATVFSHQINGETDWPTWHPWSDITLRFGRHGLACIAPEKRFMRRRMQVFRLLMRAFVHLRHD